MRGFRQIAPLLVGVLLVSWSNLDAGETVTLPRVAARSWDEIALSPVPSGQAGGETVFSRQPAPGPAPVGPTGVVGERRVPSSPAVSVGSFPRTFADLTEAAVSPVLDFDALPDNSTSIPPDTHGSVGPSHLMTMLNTEVRIQDKTGVVVSTVTLAQFWSAVPGKKFDPRIHFDATSGRWVAVCAASPDSLTSKVCFAISATDDPSGTWYFYAINGNSGGTDSTWVDYPALGFNKTWVAITANMFKITSNEWQGSKMWVINKASVLSGGTIQFSTFQTAFDGTLGGGIKGFSLQPCVTYGGSDTLYLVDASGYYSLSDTTLLLRISRIRGTAGSPVWEPVPGSYFGANGLFFVNNNFSTNTMLATQKGTPIRVDAGDYRMMNSVYRNGRIWCTHMATLPAKITNPPTRVAAFWYQLNPLTMPTPIAQSGVLDGGVDEYFIYPSIAANSGNDAVVGFSRTDDSRYPEAVYAGRRGTSPSNTMGPVQVIKQGESFYSKFLSGKRNRWGDYSNTAVDPSDDYTLWTIQEYAGMQASADSNGGRWATRWAKIDPALSITGIEETPDVPARWVLDQNFPNPFNPTTIIRYSVPVVSDVRLAVYDILGREVAVLVNEERAPGSYDVRFDASGLASGVYVYRLQSDGMAETKTLVYMK